MDLQNIFAVILFLSNILELSLQAGVIKFTPPARVFCKDDEDMAVNCALWKDKGYCKTKRSLMEAACAETCEYCSKEKFSKKIEDIIKDQQVIEKVTGDLQKTEEGLEQGNASPSAQGSFQGHGNTPAEQEATEVPNGPEKEEELEDKPPESKAPAKETKNPPKPSNLEVKKPKEESTPVKAPPSGKIGSTNGCDEACQKECIDAHNIYRVNHDAPPLVFDQILADQAQAHASKVAKEDEFKHSDWASGKGGECIGWGWVKPSWTIAVKDWHDEEMEYDFKTGKSKNGKAVGHFTQVVWKKAKKAGCGKSIMHGAPFYITQMDVVGIVTDSLPGYDKENVGLAKKPDIDWFNDMRKELMKKQSHKRNRIQGQYLNSHLNRKRVSNLHHQSLHKARISKRMDSSNEQINMLRISVNGKMKVKHQWIVEDY